MSELIFYEKPGCSGNRQQKAYLEALGHTLDVRDLLNEAWCVATLRVFFGDRPVSEWFNTSAPQIKEGWVDINDLTERQAMTLMLAEPLLIRRPLMQLGPVCQAGFVDGPVFSALNIRLDRELDLQSCPMEGESQVCRTPA